MFKGLRDNATLYILKKGNEPALIVGNVMSVSNPAPKFPTFTGQYGQQTETTVDISVKAGDERMEFKRLPSDGQIANSGDMVVSESREAMTTEVENMMRISRAVLDSVDTHRHVVESCETILSQLNPHIAKEKQQEIDISNLKTDMKGVKGALGDIRQLLEKALNKSSSNKKE